MEWTLLVKTGAALSKLDTNLVSKIHKYEDNGLRAYKKLYIWSVDISDDAKHESINKIMNPRLVMSIGCFNGLTFFMKIGLPKWVNPPS